MKKKLILIPLLTILVGCNNGENSASAPVASSTNSVSNSVTTSSINHSTSTLPPSSTSTSSTTAADERGSLIADLSKFTSRILTEGYQANGTVRRSIHSGGGEFYEICQGGVTYLKLTYNESVNESLIYYNKDINTSDWFHLVEYDNQKYFNNEIYSYNYFNPIDYDYLLKGIPSSARVTKSSSDTYRISFSKNSLTEDASNTLTDIFFYSGSSLTEAILFFSFTDRGMRIVTNIDNTSSMDINYISDLTLPFTLTSFPVVNFVSLDIANKYIGMVGTWSGNNALWIKPDWYGFDSTGADKDVFYTPISIKKGLYYASNSGYLFPTTNNSSSPKMRFVDQEGRDVTIDYETITFKKRTIYQVYKFESDFRAYIEFDKGDINKLGLIHFNMSKISDDVNSDILNPIDLGSLAPKTLYQVDSKHELTQLKFSIDVKLGDKIYFDPSLSAVGTTNDFRYTNNTDFVVPSSVELVYETIDGNELKLYKVVSDVTSLDLISYRTTEYQILYYIY